MLVLNVLNFHHINCLITIYDIGKHRYSVGVTVLSAMIIKDFCSILTGEQEYRRRGGKKTF